MTQNVLIEKSKEFAVAIVNLCKIEKSDKNESIIMNQLIRSGTSIGANIHEAKYAQGKMDFISKLSISLKECYETEYWLELLYKTEYIDEITYKNLSNQCGSIRRMLISSISTIKSKQ